MAKKTYEEQLTELETIIGAMENEEVSIDELAIKVKRASEIIAHCRAVLKNTEGEVDQILKGLSE